MTTASTPSARDFQQSHLAMIFKYSGISFISGAVNHGFFSGQRSLITAALGVVLFVIGAVMEHRQTQRSASGEALPTSLMKTLLLGTLLSIGLGFFTGGLQHFPDSPARSSWVVPLGFVVSLLALATMLGAQWKRSLALYALASCVLVGAASWGAGQYYERHASGAHHGATPDLTAGNASTQAYRAANDAMHQGMNIAFTGDADRDFLAGMIPHHQGAIDMARVVLAHGKDEKIRALAAQIIAAQEKEIADMQRWQGGDTPKPAAIAPTTDHSQHTHKH